MWNPSKHLVSRAMALCAPMSLALSVASAAVDLTSAPGGEGADKPGTKAPAKAESAKSSFRCWQYGRLIFEEVGLNWPAETPTRVLTLQQGAPGKAIVHLVETKDATCLFKEAIP